LKDTQKTVDYQGTAEKYIGRTIKEKAYVKEGVWSFYKTLAQNRKIEREDKPPVYPDYVPHP